MIKCKSAHMVCIINLSITEVLVFLVKPVMNLGVIIELF